MSCPDASAFSLSAVTITELYPAGEAPGAVRAEGDATDEPQTGMEPAEDAENSPPG